MRASTLLLLLSLGCDTGDPAAATGAHACVVRMVLDFSGISAEWTDTLAVDGGAAAPLTFTDCRSIPTVDPNHCLMRGGGG
jgi:hypothetical protein